MNQGELKIYIEGVEQDLTKVEERLKYIDQSVIPDIYTKAGEANNKITALLMLHGIYIVLLAFVLYKLFDISGKFPKP